IPEAFFGARVHQADSRKCRTINLSRRKNVSNPPKMMIARPSAIKPACELLQDGWHPVGKTPINTLTRVKTNIRCGLAIGPTKRLAAPAALPTARMYAVRTATQAAL